MPVEQRVGNLVGRGGAQISARVAYGKGRGFQMKGIEAARLFEHIRRVMDTYPCGLAYTALAMKPLLVVVVGGVIDYVYLCIITCTALPSCVTSWPTIVLNTILTSISANITSSSTDASNGYI